MKDGGVVTIDNSITMNVGHSRMEYRVGIGRSMPSCKFEIGETVFLLPSLCFFFLPFLAKTEDLIATYQEYQDA